MTEKSQVLEVTEILMIFNKTMRSLRVVYLYHLSDGING